MHIYIQFIIYMQIQSLYNLNSFIINITNFGFLIYSNSAFTFLTKFSIVTGFLMKRSTLEMDIVLLMLPDL